MQGKRSCSMFAALTAFLYCVGNVNGSPLITGYALEFPKKDVSDMVNIWGLPSMNEFTVCFWMKSNDSTDGTALSYAVPAANNEILIAKHNNFDVWIGNEKGALGVSANDGEWHHICVSWENTAGSLDFYMDSVLSANKTNFKRGHVIRSGGSLVLGQEQGSLGGGFNNATSFRGFLTNLNVWNYSLSPDTIARISKGCLFEEPGTVYKWSYFKYGVRGRPRFHVPSPCNVKGDNEGSATKTSSITSTARCAMQSSTAVVSTPTTTTLGTKDGSTANPSTSRALRTTSSVVRTTLVRAESSLKRSLATSTPTVELTTTKTTINIKDRSTISSAFSLVAPTTRLRSESSPQSSQATSTVKVVLSPSKTSNPMGDSSTVNPSKTKGALTSSQSSQGTSSSEVRPASSTRGEVIEDSSKVGHSTTASPKSTTARNAVVETSGLVSRSPGIPLQPTSSLSSVRFTSTSTKTGESSFTVKPFTTRALQSISSVVGPDSAGKCKVQCTNGKKCRQFGKFLCLCERGKKGTRCEEEDLMGKIVVVILTITNEEWKQEYVNMENMATKELVDRIKKAITEEIGNLLNILITDVTTKTLRKGSVIAEVQLSFGESVGQNEVASLLNDMTKDGQLGQFNVDEPSVAMAALSNFPTTAPTEPEKMNITFIYGPVTGVLVLMLVAFAIYGLLKRRNRQRNKKDTRRETKLSVNETYGAYENAVDEIEMATANNNTVDNERTVQLMTFSQTTRVPQGGDETVAEDGSSDYIEIIENAPLRSATQSWEVPREHVTIQKIIGKGAFGQVAQGMILSRQEGEEATTVAIKMLKENAPEAERKDLLSELELMKQLHPHPHVIKLLGCITESDPLLVIIEYVPYGDLLGYLRKSRGISDMYFNDPDIKPQTSLSSQQLMKFAWQIADGMRYLSSRNIIHRDLAARNVLVGEGETCKVTDFGMARDVQQKSIYEKKSKGRVPVKWTAHEALFYGFYTTKSDVWSFGVVLYEIFTIGGSPYPRTPARRMPELLVQGYRMPKPNHVDDALYNIMIQCWQENPDDRPTFETLRDELKDVENQHKKLINMREYEGDLYDYVDDFTV